MCAQVLQGTSEAMTARELTQAAIDQGFISTTGKARPCPAAPLIWQLSPLKTRVLDFTHCKSTEKLSLEGAEVPSKPRLWPR